VWADPACWMRRGTEVLCDAVQGELYHSDGWAMNGGDWLEEGPPQSSGLIDGTVLFGSILTQGQAGTRVENGVEAGGTDLNGGEAIGKE
jgi:hypothetical protein